MIVQDLALFVVLPVLVIAVLLALYRLAIGPRMPDRVIALDLLSTFGIGILTVYAIATDQRVYIDVATAVALISFLGTIAFAYYLEKRG